MKLLRLLVFGLCFSVACVSVAQENKSPNTSAKALSSDEIFTIWKKQKADQLVQASIEFAKVTPDQKVKNVLQKYQLLPYKIYMFLDDQYGAHTTTPDKAKLSLIDEARQISIRMREARKKSIQHRAKMLLEKGFEKRRRLAESLTSRESKRKNQVNGLRRGVPIIYGVRVMGSEENLRAVAADNAVAAMTPGFIIDDKRIAVRDPATPPLKGDGEKQQKKKSDTEIRSELKALAN